MLQVPYAHSTQAHQKPVPEMVPSGVHTYAVHYYDYSPVSQLHRSPGPVSQRKCLSTAFPLHACHTQAILS